MRGIYKGNIPFVIKLPLMCFGDNHGYLQLRATAINADSNLITKIQWDDTGRKGGDRPAGGNRRGERPGMTWALRSLCRPSAKSALTHHPQAGGGMACGRRALSRGGSAGVSSPAGIYQQTPTAACASGGAAPIHRGLGGPSATNKRHRVYTCALLAADFISPTNGACELVTFCVILMTVRNRKTRI